MSEIVKLPREVAEALGRLKQHSDYPIRLAMDIIYREDHAGDETALKEYCESDRSRRIGYIASALVNGYEVEETPEEKVKALYGKYRTGTDMHYGYRLAIIECLNALNIKIEGVNA